jgi:pimeloyl-ACP methyl ester carboxylesterase
MKNQTIRWFLVLTVTISNSIYVNKEGQRLSMAIADAALVSDKSSTPTKGDNTIKMKRILCLHGKSQSGAILSNKIAGARKKLQRVYQLDFLDGPVLLPTTSTSDATADLKAQFAWWLRDDSTGKHVGVNDAFDYVIDSVCGDDYDAILGFSQGGLLGTALALSGAFPNVKAVVTAGSPYFEEPFLVAQEKAAILAMTSDWSTEMGRQISKLHFAGVTDAMISVASTTALCDNGGNGRVIVHDKGHLFPTKAIHVNEMLQFLESTLNPSRNGGVVQDENDSTSL